MVAGFPDELPTLDEHATLVPPASGDEPPLLELHPPRGARTINPTASPEAIAVTAPALSVDFLRDDTVAMFIETYTSIGAEAGRLESSERYDHRSRWYSLLIHGADARDLVRAGVVRIVRGRRRHVQ